MSSCLLEYATVFPIKNKFYLVTLGFYFDLVPPVYFENEIAFSQPLYQFLMSHGTTLTTYPSQEVCTNLQIKKIFASEALIHHLNLRGFKTPK